MSADDELDFGPCLGDSECTSDAQVYVFSTMGASARITVVTGERGAWLASFEPGARCLECALQEVEAVGRGANQLEGTS